MGKLKYGTSNRDVSDGLYSAMKGKSKQLSLIKKETILPQELQTNLL
jgi:hypothetical protein